MSTLTTIQSSDLITNSRADINNNFSALNTDKIETSVIDTDTTLSANSDAKLPSQKAVKAYVDAGGNVNASTTAKGIVEEATEAEVIAGTSTGATGARLFINPSTANRTSFSTTQVYTGAPVNTFTDLDLSSVIGSRQRTVMLVVTYTAASSSIYFSAKTKGTSFSYPGGGTSTEGVSRGVVSANEAGNFIVVSDTSGVIQWCTSSTSNTITINVISYW